MHRVTETGIGALNWRKSKPKRHAAASSSEDDDDAARDVGATAAGWCSIEYAD